MDMSRVKGMIVSCDRCETEVFLERRDDGAADGGFSKQEVYAPLPLLWSNKNGKDLCPDCSAEYNRMMAHFYGGYADKED